MELRALKFFVDHISPKDGPQMIIHDNMKISFSPNIRVIYYTAITLVFCISSLYTIHKAILTGYKMTDFSSFCLKIVIIFVYS